MTPVFQSRDDAGERIGDCFRACIATILDLPGQEVPHFYAGLLPGSKVPPQVEVWIREWFKSRGQYFITIPMEGDTPDEVMESMSYSHPGLCYLLSGSSVKRVDHTVVCRNGKMVHDPSRLGYGLAGPTSDDYYHVHLIGVAL